MTARGKLVVSSPRPHRSRARAGRVQEAGLRSHPGARREDLHITKFWRNNSSTVVTCGGLATTPAGRTKTCTASLAPGRWYAYADVWKRDEYLGDAATDVFRFG
jgi:hypothetical protein